MALFKILKGKHNKLDAQSKTDGWAWFTPDNGNFFIDALNSDGINIDRIQINPKSITIEAEIDGSSSSLWDLDSKTFPIINTDINENYNGYIAVNTSDFNLTKQATLANFQVIRITNGSLIIQARGTLPTNTIPVIITLVPAPTPIYYTCTVNGDGSFDGAGDKIKEGSNYVVRITLDSIYESYDILATMGGVTVFSENYNSDSTCIFEISNVTDNIIVTVTGVGASEKT